MEPDLRARIQETFESLQPLSLLSQDPELYLAMKAYAYCVWWEPGTEWHALGVRLKQWLSEPATIRRLLQGKTDPYGDMRGLCGETILRLSLPERTEVALRLLSDPEWGVRDTLCEALHARPAPACEAKLAELATDDPVWIVRSSATQALAKYTPRVVIPVLLRILEEDHEHDPEFQVNPPSVCAASALDELMDTNWVETRFPDGTATFPPGPRDLEALKEQAQLYLARLGGA